MGTIAVGAATTGKLIAYGVCLGIGFWMARKLTNVADEYLMLWNESKMNKFAQEVEVELGVSAAAAKAGG